MNFFNLNTFMYVTFQLLKIEGEEDKGEDRLTSFSRSNQ